MLWKCEGCRLEDGVGVMVSLRREGGKRVRWDLDLPVLGFFSRFGFARVHDTSDTDCQAFPIFVYCFCLRVSWITASPTLFLCTCYGCIVGFSLIHFTITVSSTA